MSSPAISVIVPAYNESAATLAALHDALVRQNFADFEVIIVDDCSPEPEYSSITDPRFRVLYQNKNSGPAAARNRGAACATAQWLFFTDADCQPGAGTLAAVSKQTGKEHICMGNTVTAAQTLLGSAIGYLGFPGGGLLGFNRVWPVDTNGYTTSITSCNLAISTGTFRRLGGFDESFPVPAGEDTLLAHEALAAGLRIRYLPEQIVLHKERAGLVEYCRWQLTRGRGTYHLRRRVGPIGRYAKHRFKVFGTSFRAAPLHYAPVIALLILLMLSCNTVGYALERRRQKAASASG